MHHGGFGARVGRWLECMAALSTAARLNSRLIEAQTCLSLRVLAGDGRGAVVKAREISTSGIKDHAQVDAAVSGGADAGTGRFPNADRSE